MGGKRLYGVWGTEEVARDIMTGGLTDCKGGLILVIVMPRLSMG